MIKTDNILCNRADEYMGRVLRHMGATVMLLALWQLGSFALNNPLLPGPYETALALVDLISAGKIWPHLGASAVRIIEGTLLGLMLALPIGILLGLSRKANDTLGAIFSVLYPIPKVVFLPIIVVLIGIGDASKVFLIALVLFFQLTLLIRDAVLHIPEEWNCQMQNLHAKLTDRVLHLVLPAIAPELLSALRSTLGISLALLFIAENFASVRGLGYFISAAMDERNYPELYAGIVVLALLGVTLYALLRLVETLAVPWNNKSL